MTIHDVEDGILREVYEIYYSHGSYINIRNLYQHQSETEETIDHAVKELTERGHIETVGFGDTYRITIQGTRIVEHDRLVPDELIQRNRAAREAILHVLKDIREQLGALNGLTVDTIARRINIDLGVVTGNLNYLEIQYYVEATNGFFRLTDFGLNLVAD